MIWLSFFSLIKWLLGYKICSDAVNKKEYPGIIKELKLAVRNEKIGTKNKRTEPISERHFKQTVLFFVGYQDQNLNFEILKVKLHCFNN